MNKSIYARLIKYQATDTRSNLENFLSEAFCDLLNRMNNQQLERFFNGFMSCLQQAETDHIHWDTQLSIPFFGQTKFPDIVGFKNGIPFIVIESKINAQQTRTHFIDEGEELELLQLEVYGKWLSEHSPDGILVLLTHETRPSADFLETEKAHNYALHNRILTTWQDVYANLARVSELPLATDFQSFLKMEGLAMDNPTRQDFYSFEMMLTAGADKRIEHLMKSIRKKLKEQFPADYNWEWEKSDQPEGFSKVHQHNLIWAWTMKTKTPYEFCSWGIAFGTQEKSIPWEWNPRISEISNRPYIFFFVSTNDADRAKRLKLDLPETEIESELLPSSNKSITPYTDIKPLDEIMETRNVFEAMYNWIEERFLKATAALNRCN